MDNSAVVIYNYIVNIILKIRLVQCSKRLRYIAKQPYWDCRVRKFGVLTTTLCYMLGGNTKEFITVRYNFLDKFFQMDVV